MKKLVGIGLAGNFTWSIIRLFFIREKANGFVLYGSEEQVQQITDKNKKSERKRLL